MTGRRQHLVLVGSTATGKSALALEVARALGDIEIVSVDSMQVYRGMDIGTAKPTPVERAEVPHHLLDLAEPAERFTVARFKRAAVDVLAEIEARGNRALLVGGTGLYLQAIVDDLRMPGEWPAVRAELEREPDTRRLWRQLSELDPVGAGRMAPVNRRRVVRALEVTVGSGRPFSSYGPGLDAYPATRFRMAGVWLPREVVARRIRERYRAQLDAGFVEEVRQLATAPMSPTARQALGYKELLAHLAGACSLDEAMAEATRRTIAFARRQRVWFRRDPRITWFAAADNPSAVLPALLGDWSTCCA